MPHGPALFGPDAVLHAGDHLALEPDHQHRRDETDDEDDDHLQQHDPHVAEREIVEQIVERDHQNDTVKRRDHQNVT